MRGHTGIPNTTHNPTSTPDIPIATSRERVSERNAPDSIDSLGYDPTPKQESTLEALRRKEE